MFEGLRVLGVVPARGGSKGVPRKNLRALGGRPLLAWTAETARAERALDRVLLSTEDPEIARVGREWGLETPFLRPAELARDDTPTLEVLLHAVGWVRARGEEYDVVVLLQPTAPFRPPGLVEAALRLLVARQGTSVVTVRRVPEPFHPHWVFLPGADGALRLATGGRDPIPRRQDLPPAYIRDGRLYATRTRVLLEERSLYGDRCLPLELPEDSGINIDTLEDFARAEAMARSRRLPAPAWPERVSPP